QLLADSFARLEGLKTLCAIGRAPRQRAFYSYLDACDPAGEAVVPDVGPLLKDSYRSAVRTLSDDRAKLLERRNRFLDFLLATYGERGDALVSPGTPLRDAAGRRRDARSLRMKLKLLRRLTRVGRDRGRGAEYGAQATARQIAGLEFKTRLQLGM